MTTTIQAHAYATTGPDGDDRDSAVAVFAAWSAGAVVGVLLWLNSDSAPIAGSLSPAGLALIGGTPARLALIGGIPIRISPAVTRTKLAGNPRDRDRR